jgi:hypothetical protein
MQILRCYTFRVHWSQKVEHGVLVTRSQKKLISWTMKELTNYLDLDLSFKLTEQKQNG